MNNGFNNQNMNGYPGRPMPPNGMPPQYPNQQPGYMNGPVPQPTPGNQAGGRPSIFDSSYNENLAKLDKEIEESQKADKKLFMIIGGVAALFVIGVVVSIVVNSFTSTVKYIEGSKENTMVVTANNYVKSIKLMVESSTLKKVTDGNLLILIPVGHDSVISCATFESGGESPFSPTWKVAYVGVIYNVDNEMFDYYFLGVDGAGYGIAFASDVDLSDGNTDVIQKDMAEYTSGLQKLYVNGKNQGKQSPDKYGDADLNDFATNIGATNVAVLSITDCSKLKG